MKENFSAALKFVLSHECVFASGHYGDYSKVICESVAGDAGGLTKFGIDQRSHPHINIRALDYFQAAQIYHDGDWTKCRCDELPIKYDLAVFDIAVLNGAFESILLLQRGLNSALVPETLPTPLSVDGFIGPKTIAAASKGGAAGLAALLAHRETLFYDIVAEHPKDQKFLRGWLNRNHELAHAVTAT